MNCRRSEQKDSTFSSHKAEIGILRIMQPDWPTCEVVSCTIRIRINILTETLNGITINFSSLCLPTLLCVRFLNSVEHAGMNSINEEIQIKMRLSNKLNRSRVLLASHGWFLRYRRVSHSWQNCKNCAPVKHLPTR